jgi:hypothetical protein
MSEEYEDFKKSKERLDAAKNAAKPNNEQIQAHVADTIAKAQKSLRGTIEFCEDRLKKLTKPK